MFRLFDALESVEMHGNVFHGAGGAGVNLLREVEADWVAGRVVGGDRNWVTSGSQNVPPEWTGTITGTDPGFANFAALDLRPGRRRRDPRRGPAGTTSPPAIRSPRRSSRRPRRRPSTRRLRRDGRGPAARRAPRRGRVRVWNGRPGYPRPKARRRCVSRSPAFAQCTSPNRQHGPPLAFGSCSPPQPRRAG